VSQVKLFLVDDERLALLQLERMVRQAFDSFTIELYQNPVDAVEQARSKQPDVVFLDIHMPEISGLEAAELIQSACPATDVVFVTAYDEYALQAFELNAVDYVLKPLERLMKLRRVQTDNAPAAAADAVQQIQCFKTLKLKPAGKQPEVPKWRTAKAQELFAYLLHYRGQIVHKPTLLELFFPDNDVKKAMTQLYTAIYQIRQCLQKMEMGISLLNSSIQEGYVLDIGTVELDVVKWERELERIGTAVALHHERLLQLLNEYEGDYLQDYGYVWAEPESERLRQLWLQNARLLISHYRSAHAEPAALLQLCERVQRLEPYNEEEALQLLQLYEEHGFLDKAVAHYRWLEDEIEKELGVSLSPEIEEWYEEFRGKRLDRKN
jgi:two-component system LytT family response regulator